MGRSVNIMPSLTMYDMTLDDVDILLRLNKFHEEDYKKLFTAKRKKDIIKSSNSSTITTSKISITEKKHDALAETITEYTTEVLQPPKKVKATKSTKTTKAVSKTTKATTKTTTTKEETKEETKVEDTTVKIKVKKTTTTKKSTKKLTKNTDENIPEIITNNTTNNIMILMTKVI
jgi:hypothetical protein